MSTTLTPPTPPHPGIAVTTPADADHYAALVISTLRGQRDIGPIPDSAAAIISRHVRNHAAAPGEHFEVIVDDVGRANWRLKRGGTPGRVRLAAYGITEARRAAQQPVCDHVNSLIDVENVPMSDLERAERCESCQRPSDVLHSADLDGTEAQLCGACVNSTGAILLST